MNICRGCGGELGRDCWNEMDCMQVSESHKQQDMNMIDYRLYTLEVFAKTLMQRLEMHGIDVSDLIPEAPVRVPTLSDDLPF